LLDSCTTPPSLIYRAKGWFQPNAVAGDTKAWCSSDLYNSCTSALNESVPGNDAGYQFAKTGNGYTGIIFLEISDTNYREYIEGSLLSSLKANKKYCVEFYVSKADRWSRYATDDIGLYFTNDSLLDNRPSPLPTRTIRLFPHIKNVSGNIITDTSNWVKISGEYIAHGGEKYFTIGNFSSFNNTNYILAANGVYDYAYYFIDDISVTLCDTTPASSSSLTIPNAFSPNNDGHNDLFTLHGWKNSVAAFTIIIYDRWGEKVFESNDPEIAWDGTYKGALMGAAVFAYYINATVISGEKIIRKGNISLIR